MACLGERAKHPRKESVYSVWRPGPRPSHPPLQFLCHPDRGDLELLDASCKITLPLSPPHTGESSPEHPQSQGLSPLAPQTQSPPVLPPPTREPEPPSCHERPAPHPTPHPGGSSHNAYRARAWESSPSTHASARSSSAFLPPHAAAVSPRLVSRPEEGEWPARRVLPTPTASRPLLWPPKPAPPAQQEALRSGPSPTTSPHTPSPTHQLVALRSGPWKLGAPPCIEIRLPLSPPHTGESPPPPSTLRARGSRLSHPRRRAHPPCPPHLGAGAPFLPRASSAPPHPPPRRELP
ncbi:uncharacterized protein [Eschrichtius robustus]|uniref:uncharacterized protein n=1 Tax=Eschrichtius robustus TaxID=9764 RepID=UPI0035C0689F